MLAILVSVLIERVTFMHFYLPALLGAADGLQLADYVVVLIYMLVVVGIGLFFSRQQHSSEDFFLGGRNVPWFAAGISLIVSLISTLTYLGATGEVIRHGLAYNLAYWAMLPAFCVIIFAWLPFFMRLGLTSVYEYLERRYGLAAHWLGLALFTLILRVGWVAVIVVTLAKAAAHITHASATNLLGWEVDLENWLIFLIVTVGIVATLYTMLGGDQGGHCDRRTAVLCTDGGGRCNGGAGRPSHAKRTLHVVAYHERGQTHPVRDCQL